MTTGIIPLGRPTFDVPYAQEKLDAMLARLDRSRRKIVGPRELLMDGDATRAAIADLAKAKIDNLLVLQVTFTDAATIVEAAHTLDVPLGIWAVPEPRIGGRLRLNAFCGLNLASHALGKAGKPFAWAYADGEDLTGNELKALISGEPNAKRPQLEEADPNLDMDVGLRIAAAISKKRIGRIGAHPDGFETCAYDSGEIDALVGVSVDELELSGLFERAGSVKDADIVPVRTEVESVLEGLDTVDQTELDRSLRLKVALDGIRKEGSYDAFAIRCWPETFTEYGGAICGPVSMLGEGRLPCACEADVYGALTQLVLQEAAQAPVFLTDLVDVDVKDDTAIVWHCGQAPASMRAPDGRAEATIHTNRKMPLLYEFALKDGFVTFARISQAFGETKMVIGGGQMLERPMAFTGTSGTVRFDTRAPELLDRLIAGGVEHHMALAYGDHRAALRSTAAVLGLPVLEL